MVYVTAALYLQTIWVTEDPAVQVPDVRLSVCSVVQNVCLTLTETGQDGIERFAVKTANTSAASWNEYNY